MAIKAGNYQFNKFCKAYEKIRVDFTASDYPVNKFKLCPFEKSNALEELNEACTNCSLVACFLHLLLSSCVQNLQHLLTLMSHKGILPWHNSKIAPL
uniref:Uncharacterized protein n=1 Tax=Rhizophora mucronata TaxID=61149 RepID=A0A2P2J3L2_RHIMU